MTARSPLFGRRIHIAGSTSTNDAVASKADIEQSRDLVAVLVRELMIRGATFVVPVDAEKTRDADGLPICFDWLVWQALRDNLTRRPANAPVPLAIAVEHYKSEDQIPPQFHQLWDDLRASDLVRIENASYWNMNSKRMEVQARWGDILLALGGTEGVLFLANIYHDAGKPVVPLNLPLTPKNEGALRRFAKGLSSADAPRLFQVTQHGAHAWMNRINFSGRTPVAERARAIIDLLEALEPPKAFAVRLLNPEHPDFASVQEFFDVVVQPIIEGELGYRMIVVDGRQAYEQPRIDQEIFAKLHRSRIVLADITGMRPNCFLELGYAFGRSLPTMLMVKEGADHPFDIHTFAGLHWKAAGPVDDRRRAFREHWNAIQNRPPLVPMEPLIS
jgi:hypothetical protein